MLSKNLYPYNAGQLTISIVLWPFFQVNRLLPRFVYKKDLTEFAKEQGSTIWFASWLWFQISYSRLL